MKKDSLCSISTLRALLGEARDAIRRTPETGLERWRGMSLARFATWMAAVEGAIDLIPDVVDLLGGPGVEGTGGTYADFQGALDALPRVLEGADEADLAEILSHRSAHVRRTLASSHRAALANDAEPTVRFSARFQYAEPTCNPPWWRGVLPTLPAEVPAALELGELVVDLRHWNNWSESYKITAAFQALPAAMAGEIAPMFVSALWCPPSWVEAVWKALLTAPVPLATRVTRAEEAISRLLSWTAGVEPAHDRAIDLAIGACPAEERAAFEPARARLRPGLVPSERTERDAPWTRVPRTARSKRKGDLGPAQPRAKKGKAEPPKKEGKTSKVGVKVTRCPPGLFERLVAEIAEPADWGRSRFAEHPRARFELARWLEHLFERSPMMGDAAITARRLADIAAACQESRPTDGEAMAQALAGLLRALDLDDPIWPSLVGHASPLVREAVALSGLGNDSRYSERLLSDPHFDVWLAARMACPSREPWRGLLVSDPFEGCLPEEAEALVPALIELDSAVPLTRRRSLLEAEAEWPRIGRAANALPDRIVCAFVPRLLPDDHLHRPMGLVGAALLAAEGGWETWLAEVRRRLETSKEVGEWFASYLVSNAAEQADSPPDGGPPLVWPIERRRASAREALRLWKREGPKSEARERWLQVAVTLWPKEDDPGPLPGPWNGEYPGHWVRERMNATDLRREWELTRRLMDGAREGFKEPWAYWHGVETCLEHLPPDLLLEAALEGFWRAEKFGEWSRKKVREALSAARAEGEPALSAFLADPRLALDNLLRPDRRKQSLFVRRARLEAGLSDFAEALLVLTLIALDPEEKAANSEELAGYRARWTEAIQTAMVAGPGGSRGVFVTLSPPDLWEPLDRSFVHAVAADATLEEAGAIARRLSTCGDSDDLAVVTELRERYPSAAAWDALASALSARAPSRTE